MYPQCVQPWPRRLHNHVQGSHNQKRSWFTQTRAVDNVLFVFPNYRGQALEVRVLDTYPRCVNAPHDEAQLSTTVKNLDDEQLWSSPSPHRQFLNRVWVKVLTSKNTQISYFEVHLTLVIWNNFVYPQCVQLWPRRLHNHVKGSHNQKRSWFTQTRGL